MWIPFLLTIFPLAAVTLVWLLVKGLDVSAGGYWLWPDEPAPLIREIESVPTADEDDD